jgi:hypothetical protein
MIFCKHVLSINQKQQQKFAWQTLKYWYGQVPVEQALTMSGEGRVDEKEVKDTSEKARNADWKGNYIGEMRSLSMGLWL